MAAAESDEQVRDAFRDNGTMTKEELAEGLGWTVATADKSLCKMRRTGELEMSERGRYRLAQEAKARLS